MTSKLIPTLSVTLMLFMSIWSTGEAQKARYAPLQIRFNTPTSLRGVSPWYAGHPEQWKGKVPITYQAASSVDPYWENASLPIGNGSVGANVFGAIATERISLNEKSLWTGGPGTSKDASYYWNVNKQSANWMVQIRAAFEAGDSVKASRLTEEHLSGVVSYEPDGEKPFRFGNYTTMGELLIRTGVDSARVSDYSRVLSLDSAFATVSFRVGGVRYLRRSFISYPDRVMVMLFRAGTKQHLVLSYDPNPMATGQTVAWGKDGIVYTAALNNNGMRYCIRLRALTRGGKVTNRGGKLEVEAQGDVLFLLTADTDYKMNLDPNFQDPKTYVGPNPDVTTAAWMKAAAAKPYAALMSRHVADYKALFDRVKLEINPDSYTALNRPTGERLKDYRKGVKDSYLEALYYQYGRYLLIASSRPGSLPANLQGIWLNNIDGPWRVDYHNNINIQMNYWPALTTNLAECQKPLTDYIRMLEKPGEVTAKSFFGTRGWTASISTNAFGFTAPLRDRSMQWNLNPMAGPWLATHLWEYYDFTRDKAWLREVGYPLIASSAWFAYDYLWKRPGQPYTATPTTSPEHGPVDVGTTYAHAIVREILTDAMAAARTLGVDAAACQTWQEAMDRLAPYKIGRYGQLMEWSKDIDDPTDQHRHVNHLFGLHPGHTISPLTTPELAQAARVVLEHRGDGATGWSMGWKLNQWARLLDGNHAYLLYGNLLKNGTADNLWDLHPPFQIDGNFGGTAGVTEMLLQSQTNCIHLLPALPDAWQDGSVSGLRARGDFGVSIKWKGGKLEQAIITSDAGGTCTVRYGDKTETLNTEKGKSYTITMDNEQLTIH